MSKTYLYIGNWHGKRGTEKKLPSMPAGIAQCEFDTETGKIKLLKNDFGSDFYAVGKCCIDAERGMLYANDEREDLPGLRSGGGSRVLSFRIDRASGLLTKAGEIPSYGSKASYLCSGGQGRFLLVSNHGGRGCTTTTGRDASGKFRINVQQDESNIVLFPIDENGLPSGPSDIFRLSGSGPKPFQHGPHAHCIVRAPGQELYAVCDKGGDQLYMLRLDYASGRLIPCQPPYRHTPGSACRYCAFHPTKPWLYMDCEAVSSIAVFRYDAEGRLSPIECIDSLAPGRPAPPEDALCQTDILIDSSGKNLYVASRVVNTICVYAIDQHSGTLRHRQTVDTAPGGVRMMCQSPGGRFLLVSYPFDSRVDVHILEDDGLIGPVADSLIQPTPATLNFFQA